MTEMEFGRVKPMLAERGGETFDSDEYLYEVKWDGTRCLVFVEGEDVRFQNRRLRDITFRYPEFHPLPNFVKCDSGVLDGELVVLDEDGLPDFKLIQKREHVQEELRIDLLSREYPATYYVFDILERDGSDRMGDPLRERRAELRRVVRENERIRISPAYGEGRKLFEKVIKLGMEGVMAKEEESRYKPGERSDKWLKFKKSRNFDCIVCGYTKGEGWRAPLFGSLILGLYKGEQLVYVGRVGTGFGRKEMEEILEELEGLKSESPPFDGGIDLPSNIEVEE